MIKIKNPLFELKLLYDGWKKNRKQNKFSFYPENSDEAIRRVNNGTSTSDDHNYLEREWELQKYVRSKIHKLLGETIVYISEFDKDKTFVREIWKHKFFNAGQAVKMEKDVKEYIPPITNGDEDRYIKIGYTHNTSKQRNGEQRWDIDKKPGKGEMYPYSKLDELLKLCKDIENNYEIVRGVSPK
jgi:hypothetical protein